MNPRDDRTGVFSVDGVDLWDLLTGATKKSQRKGPIVLAHEFNMTVNRTVTTMGALLHNDWKLIVGEQGYADYRGDQFPCKPATPGPNCDPYCLFNCKPNPHPAT